MTKSVRESERVIEREVKQRVSVCVREGVRVREREGGE